ncbi:hypothetical protein GCM10022267_88760 [Lentzea roselyniae]|uniref:Carrier domain-containing protein n=1 Tax=Lentzea roselyniae TaxID=531940 RepID=A0ABP7CDT1_9PSEU
MRSPIVFLFPGQGAYLPGAFRHLAEEPIITELLSEVDEVATSLGAAPVTTLLMREDAPSLDDLLSRSPAQLHVAIFAAELALYRLLTRRHGIQPDVLLGHSFGELTALTAAGVFDLRQGLRLVIARDAAFADCPPEPGAMVALGTSADRARHVIGAVGRWDLCLAADNGPQQTVVSGPEEDLGQLMRVAETLGITARRLSVPYSFHNPGLAGVAERFIERIRELTPRVPVRRVHSAVLSRDVCDSTDVAALVAAHLVRPTYFLGAVRALRAEGVEIFLECGPRGTLSDLIAGFLPDTTVIAPLRRRVTGPDLDRLLEPVPHHQASIPDQRGTTTVAEPAPVRGREELISDLRTIYAETLGYPVEMLTADADLEADLGIDSITQTELFAKAVTASSRSLPADDSDVRPTSFTTLRALSDFLLTLPVGNSVTR